MPGGGGGREAPPRDPPLADCIPAFAVIAQNASVRALKSPVRTTGVPSWCRRLTNADSIATPRARHREASPRVLAGLCTLMNHTSWPLTRCRSLTYGIAIG